MGWEYQRVGELGPVRAANLRWLVGYRHPRYARPGLAARLRVVFAGPTSLLAGAAAVGDPVAVLPVLFGMLWRGELAADLDTCRLSRSSADSQARSGRVLCLTRGGTRLGVRRASSRNRNQFAQVDVGMPAATPAASE